MDQSAVQNQKKRKPFFYDVTLRDGNQALRNPWNLEEKEKVFHQLIKLGVPGIEVSYPGASDMDFEAAQHPDRLFRCSISQRRMFPLIKSCQ